MNVQITIRYKNGKECSYVCSIDEAFRKSDQAEKDQDVAGFCIESEAK